MGRYNFDEVVVRRGTNCVKWDENLDAIPMWVADMDFRVAPAIQDALRQRVEHGVFGYNIVPESYYEAIISWFSRRHGWQIDRQSILYTTAVVPAMSCVIKALTMPGEKVLILSPAYNCFFSSIKNNGCEVLESSLECRVESVEFATAFEDEAEASSERRAVANSTLSTLHSQLHFEVDWDDFESKCADEKTTLFLLCNPHNPCGRVWTREELQHMYDICHRHGVILVSDEIHCELIMPGQQFVPFGTITDDCVVMNSPSKNFNTAGLQIANVITKNPAWRRRIDRAININEVCDVNPFGIVALEAAYNKSEDWLDALNLYLWDNYRALCDFVSVHLPMFKVTALEGTYLVWIDHSALGLSTEAFTQRLLGEAHVRVSPGTMYGPKTGEGHIRVNIACPRSQLMEALRRIASCC